MSVDDEYLPYVDQPDEVDESTIGGTSPPALSQPDEAPMVELVQRVTTMIFEELDRERRQHQAIVDGSTINVNTNTSGQVLFQRYALAAGGAPIQIVREKAHRGDIIVVCYTDGVTASIGQHAGIQPLGTDTAAVVGTLTGTARTIRTRSALWAVASVACVIDVQEEFD